jgi:predicted permease
MNWVQRLLLRGRLERELDKELQYDFELRVAALVAQGVAPQEAARRVRLEFGGADEIKEACRDARGARWLEDFIRDCRYGLRTLRRSPVFTSVAILSLALGIGANTAIFSLMDRVMFRMMPVRQPEQLVQITRFHPPYGAVTVSYPLFQSLGKGLGSFEGLLAHSLLGARDITIDGNPETVDFDLVSGSYYPLLGVHAAIGRTFDEAADGAPGAPAVAVISHRYWERRFASNPSVIGKTFRRLDTVFTIVGVTPRDFFGTVVGKEPDITVPITMDAQVRGGASWLHEPNYQWLSVMGRLKPGVGVNQARAEAKQVFANIIAADATSAELDSDRRGRLGEYVELQPGGNGFDNLRRRFAEPLTILMGTVALVLLLACANLANLLLAKSAARQREIAVRLAIGAGRGRVIRQLVAEGLLLALAGGTLGVLLAYGFAERLVTAMSNGGPRMLLDVAPNARVLFFAAAVSTIACILFSLTPALQATRQSFQPALAEVRAGRWRLGKGLIVAQMAISVLLLIGAGLFGRTLINMYALDPGFDRHGVILFSTNAAQLRYTRPRIQEMQIRVPAELEALPGVRSASVSMFAPISGGGWDGGFLVEGHPPTGSQNDISHVNSVGVDFFKTFRTPVVLGREFNQRDTDASPRVVVVNQAFAGYYFPDQSPLGKWVAFEGPERDSHYQVVGVVKDVKYESLRHDFPRTIYMMNAQVPPGPDSYTFAVRTDGGMTTAVEAIRAALAHVDPELRPVSVLSLEDHVTRSLLQERMLATLAMFFGALALLLGAVGIYGTMAFQVARRRREIGIRMALGADEGSVIAMVLGQTARLTLAGCAIGAAAGLALTRIAEGILYGVRANDPLTFITAAAGLLLIALAAAYLPGHSAARTNPVDTLRVD